MAVKARRHRFEWEIIKNPPQLEPVWRLTFELEARLGVRNELSDDTGAELARMLGEVDALITTPSTCMLEGMLHSIPVALLDYHGCPSYVPAAWSITAPEFLDRVLPDLVSPPAVRLLPSLLVASWPALHTRHAGLASSPLPPGAGAGATSTRRARRSW